MQPHRPRLSRLSCLLSSLALCISLIIAIMAVVGIIEVPWDSEFWPAATAFVLVPLCVLSVVVALISLFKNRDGLSVLGLILGVAAVG
ncbi:MAG: hypothetical protein IAF94_11265, partial [Pirellulaceae bacterium]|nr:hypothetical protein [Pirellulaceae bacterium]